MSDTISSPQKQALIEAVARAVCTFGNYPPPHGCCTGSPGAPKFCDKAARSTIAAIEAAGYRIVRSHDWHPEWRFAGDPLVRMVCRRCGKRDGEVPLSAECGG